MAENIFQKAKSYFQDRRVNAEKELEKMNLLQEILEKYSWLDGETSSRIALINRQNNFYIGNQWEGTTRKEDRRQEIINVSAPMVNTYAALLGMDTLRIKAKEKKTTQPAQDATGEPPAPESFRAEMENAEARTKIIQNILKESNFKNEGSDGAINGSKYGYTILYVRWDPEKKLPIIENIYPGYFRAGFSADDFRKMNYAFFTIPMVPERAEKEYGIQLTKDDIEASTMIDVDGQVASWNKQPKVLVRRYYDENSWTLTVGKTYVVPDDNGVVERQTNYGRVPFFLIPNISDPQSPYGIADLNEAVMDVQKSLNEAYSDWSNMIDIESGTKIIAPTNDPDTINALAARGPKVIPWDFKKPMPTLLGWGNRNISMVDRLKFLCSKFYEITGLSEVFMTRPETSILTGVSLTALTTPTLKRLLPRRLNWERGMSEVLAFCMELLEKKGGKEPTSGKPYKEIINGYYDVEFIWDQKLIRDEALQIQNELMKVDRRVQSRKTAMENLGINNPADELDQISFEEINPLYNPEGAMKAKQIEAGQTQGPPMDQVIEQAQAENEAMMQGQAMPVNEKLPQENEAHIKVHGQAFTTQLPGQIQKIFDDHVAEHENRIRYTKGGPGQGQLGGRPEAPNSIATPGAPTPPGSMPMPPQGMMR